MPKTYNKAKLLSVVFIPALSLAFGSAAYAETMPDVYKFLPQNSVAALSIKTSGTAWPLLQKNKSLQKIDFLKELKTGKNDNPVELLFDPQVKNNIGNNVLVSLAAVDTAKDPEILMVAEMKNTGKTTYIKNKFNKMFLSKKDGKLLESKFRDVKVYSYIAKDPKNTKYAPGFLAFHKNYVLMSNSFNIMQTSMKTFYRETPGLSYSSDFVKSYDKLGSNHQMQLFLDMKKVAKLLTEADKNEKKAKGKADDIDLSMLKNLFANNSLMMNLQLNPKNIDIKSYTITDKSSEYYKMLQQSKPSDFKKYTAYLPKNTLLFMGMADLKDAGKNIKTLLPFNFSGELEKVVRESAGISLLDLADNLQNDMAIAAFNTEANPLIPGFAFFMTPRDKNKMDQLLKSVKIDFNSFDKKAGKGNRKQKQEEQTAKPAAVMQFTDTTNYKSITIHRTNELTDLAEFNARPAYAYLGEDVILASNEDAVKAVIDMSSAAAGDFSLNGNPSFLKLKETVGNNNNGIFYLNLGTIINMVSSFFAGEKDSKEMIANLKKFEAIGSSSLTDTDGITGHMVLLADLENIDFNKLMPPEKKKAPKKAAPKKK